MKLKDILLRLLGHSSPDPEAFRRKRVRSKRRLRFSTPLVVSIIVVALLLVGGVSLAVLFGDDDDEIVPSREITKLNAQIEKTVPEMNILLGVSAHSNSDLTFLSAINFDGENGVNVRYLPLTVVSEVESATNTLKGFYNVGGVSSLVSAVRNFYHFNIDRYVILSETNLSVLLSGIGEIPVTIDENINHSYNGVSIIIEKGQHHYNGDMSIKYLNYLFSTLPDNVERLELFSKIILEKAFSNDENGTNDGRLEKIFRRNVDNAITDISVVDISDYGSAIDLLLKNSIEKEGLSNFSLKKYELNSTDEGEQQ